MKSQFSKLDSSWSPEGVEISSLPGTRSAHYFQALTPYTIKMALTAAQRETNPTYFSFKTGIISNPSPAPHHATASAPVHAASTQPPVQEHLNVGTWVEVVYDMVTYYGLILEIENNNYQIRCLKLAEGGQAYKFEPERDAVWYKKEDIVKTMSNVPSLIHSRGVYYKV